MVDDSIERIRKILKYRGRSDLAELLRYSVSHLDESTTYGSYLFSTLSTFEICSPIENNEILKSLSKEDKKTILEAVVELYPPKAYSPEITSIRFLVDTDLSPGHGVIVCSGLKQLGFEYIQEQIEKSEEKIMKRDYDGAITNARALIETVCLYILEESKIPYESDGNLIKLYKEVYKVLKMDPSLYQEDSFKQILSGIISIINGLSNVRNAMSDAHGRSKTKYYKPTDRHAIQAVNIAKVISEFLYACWKSRNKE
jgi:predicted transcriptional regulator with HTH domain